MHTHAHGAGYVQLCTKSRWRTDLFNGVLLAGHFSHLGDDPNVILELHLQALGEGQVGLGANREAQLLRELQQPTHSSIQPQNTRKCDVRACVCA